MTVKRGVVIELHGKDESNFHHRYIISLLRFREQVRILKALVRFEVGHHGTKHDGKGGRVSRQIVLLGRFLVWSILEA